MNLVLSSAGRRGAMLAILRRTLADMDLKGTVIATDMSLLTAAGMLAEEFRQVSPCTDPAFIPQMLELCRSHEVRLVVPTIDPELPVYAAHRQAFLDIGTTVLVSDLETVELCADKRSTHKFLSERGFPTVSQAHPSEVLASLRDWNFPLVVKPARGSASKGIAVVHGEAELTAAAAGREVVVQSVAPGDEYTVDVWVDAGGAARCAVPRRRLEVRAGEVSKGVTAKHGPLQELALQVCEALPDPYGVITVQAFVDAGDLRVIEINPRFGGGFPLAWQAGAKYPQWALEELLGRQSTATADDGWAGGLVMLRYDEAAFVDAGTVGL